MQRLHFILAFLTTLRGKKPEKIIRKNPEQNVYFHLFLYLGKTNEI